jgi:PAS domain S-box-containing protein
MDFKRTTDIQVVQNTNHITLDDPNVVESSNDAIITKSLDDIIISWNKGAEQVYGYLAEEVLGQPISMVPSYSDQETKKLTEMIKHGEKVQQYEISRIKKDGKLIDVSLSLSPVYDTSGKLTAISIIARDITERKKMEEKLRESEEKYRNIVETSNEGIIIVDNEAIITYANKKMADMIGYTLEESVGRQIWGFLSEEFEAVLRLNLKKRWMGIDGSYESRLIRKDGSPIVTRLNNATLYELESGFCCII